MSLEILRWTADDGRPYCIAESDRWRYELAIEAGEMSVDDLALGLLARQRRIEFADPEQTDEDRTVFVEVLHHHGRGAPAVGVA